MPNRNPLSARRLLCVAAAVVALPGSLHTGTSPARTAGAGGAINQSGSADDGLPSLWQGTLLAPNGGVEALAASGRTLYVGGTFTEFSRRTGPFAVFARSSSKPSTLPTIAGAVYAVAEDGRGGWFVGGEFESVGGCPNLAHIRADREVDTLWCPRPDDAVFELLRSGSRLYVAGRFSRIGGRARPALAALDVRSGRATGWAPNPRPKEDVELGGSIREVYALARWGSTLYVGGAFSAIGGRPRDSLAAIDVKTGQANAWNPKLEPPDDRGNATVGELALTGSTVYVAGGFASVGGKRRYRLAALDATTGRTSDWNPSPDGVVQAIVISNSSVYFGGGFEQFAGRARVGLAAVDRRTSTVTNWQPRVYGGDVHALAVSGRALLVGGGFSGLGAKKRRGLAAVELKSGRVLSWGPTVGGPPLRDAVSAIAVWGARVAVGGSFQSVGRGLPRPNVAALDPRTGRLLPWSVRVDGDDCNAAHCVSTLALSGSTLYIGGTFTRVDGQPRSGLAAVDATTGRLKPWNPGVAPWSLGVMTLAVADSTVYVGGWFERVGGQPRSRLAAVDATTGRVLAWNPNVDGCCIEAIAVVGSTVYVGGWFNRIGGEERHGLAALDAMTGKTTEWNPNPSNSTRTLFSVRTLAVFGSTVYVGGRFERIGGQPRRGLAAVSATTGRILPWNPSPDREVEALSLSDSAVYAGGNFDVIGGKQRGIAAIDHVSGNVGAWNPNISRGRVDVLLATSQAIYAGGHFPGAVAAFPQAP